MAPPSAEPVAAAKLAQRRRRRLRVSRSQWRIAIYLFTPLQAIATYHTFVHLQGSCNRSERVPRDPHHSPCTARSRIVELSGSRECGQQSRPGSSLTNPGDLK